MKIPRPRRIKSWLLGCLLLLTGTACSGTESWQDYKAHFITPQGRILDTGNGNVSHSEGQGWGMILALAFDDRDTFATLWRWTQANLARDDLRLFAWRYDPAQQPPVSDRNNATDGDLFIAWALALAGERWQNDNYRVAATAIRDDIARHLVREVAGYTVLLPGLQGFVAEDSTDLNLSYWFMPALQYFAAQDPAGPWQRLMDDGRRLLRDGRFGDARLPVDWLRLHEDGRLEPSPAFPARFGFDAVRIPLYFAWVGQRGAEGLAEVAAFWREGAASSAWVNVTTGERADYPVSAGVAAVQALLAGGDPDPGAVDLQREDYYSASLLLLSHIAAHDGP